MLGSLMVSIGADISALAAKMKTAEGMVGAAAAAMAAASGVIAAGLGSAVDIAADFEQKMSKVKALTGEGADAMANMRQVAIDLGGSSVFSASQVADGMATIGAAGLSATEVIAAMPGVLDAAAAAGEDFGRVSDIMISVRGQFQLAAGDMGHIGDVLAGAANASKAGITQIGESLKYAGPTAKAFGTSLETTAGMLAILSNSGIEASQAGTTLNATMLRMISDNKHVAAAFQATHTAIKDTHGNLLPFEQIIGQVAKGMRGMTDAQRLHTAQQIAGTEHAAGFLALLKAGEAGIASYAERVGAAGQAHQMALTQTDNLRGSVEQLKGAWETAKIAIGDALIPAVRAVVDGLTGMVGAFNALPGPIQAATSYAAAAAAGLLALGAAAGVAALAWGPLTTILTTGGTALLGIAEAVGGPVLALGALATAMTYGVVTSEGLRKAWNDLANSPAVTTMASALSQLGDAIYTSLSGVLGAVGGIFRGLADAAAPGLLALGQSVATGMGQVALYAAGGLRAMNTLVPQALEGVRVAFSGIALEVRTVWGELWPQLRSVASTFGAWLSAWATAAMATLNAAVRQATTYVTTTFGGAWAWVQQATARMLAVVHGYLGGGMAAAAGSARGALSWLMGAFNQAYTWIDNATGGLVTAVSNKISALFRGLVANMGAIGDLAKAWGAEVAGTFNLEIARAKAAAAGAVTAANLAGPMSPPNLRAPGAGFRAPQMPGAIGGAGGGKGAGGGAAAQADEIAEAWKRLKVSLATVDAEASVLGATYDKLGGQHQALESGIKAIVGAYVAKGKAIPTAALAQYTKQLAAVTAQQEAHKSSMEAAKRASEEIGRAQQATGNAYAELGGKLRMADADLALSAGTTEDQKKRLEAVAVAYRDLLKDFAAGKVEVAIPFAPEYLDKLREQYEGATAAVFRHNQEMRQQAADAAIAKGALDAWATTGNAAAQQLGQVASATGLVSSQIGNAIGQVGQIAVSFHQASEAAQLLKTEEERSAAATVALQAAMGGLASVGIGLLASALTGIISQIREYSAAISASAEATKRAGDARALLDVKKRLGMAVGADDYASVAKQEMEAQAATIADLEKRLSGTKEALRGVLVGGLTSEHEVTMAKALTAQVGELGGALQAAEQRAKGLQVGLQMHADTKSWLDAQKGAAAPAKAAANVIDDAGIRAMEQQRDTFLATLKAEEQTHAAAQASMYEATASRIDAEAKKQGESIKRLLEDVRRQEDQARANRVIFTGAAFDRGQLAAEARNAAEEAGRAASAAATAKIAQPISQALTTGLQNALNAAVWDFSSFEQSLLQGMRGAVVNAITEAFSTQLTMPKLQPLLAQLSSAIAYVATASSEANAQARMAVASDLAASIGAEAKALMATYKPLIEGARRSLDAAFGLPGQPGGGPAVGGGGSSSGGASGSLFPFATNGGLPPAQTSGDRTIVLNLSYQGGVSSADADRLARMVVESLQRQGALQQ